MMIFRRARLKDLDAIFSLAIQSGYGITTLPKEKKLLKKRLEDSSNSFDKEVSKPENECYFFVLEDSENRKIVGTAAIEAYTGHATPFYSYKISKKTRICNSLKIRSDYEILSLVNDYQGYSELCTLYLEPSYRLHGNGLLLSRSRFLFMAQFPTSFAAFIIAEMRGISDDLGHSPLWDNLGRNFFHMSFIEADSLTISTNKQFISDLMPRNPVYISLLPSEARAVIGKPHVSTISAMNILLREGFRYNKYVDIFDGGPTLEAPKEQINTIASSQILKIVSLSDEVSSARYLISNTSRNFRAVIGELIMNETKANCIIAKKIAKALKVKVGDYVRFALLNNN